MKMKMACVALVLMVGCKKKAPESSMDGMNDGMMDAVPTAHAMLMGMDGSPMGTISAMQQDGGVMMSIRARGVPGAGGEHGFHVHEGSSCEPPMFDSAGGHFNPYSAEPHGGPMDARHHAGDMGNVSSNSAGVVDATVMIPGLSLTAGKTQAIGHAVILHSGRDDLSTQPSGNSGKRIACGILVEGPLPMP